MKHWTEKEERALVNYYNENRKVFTQRKIKWYPHWLAIKELDEIKESGRTFTSIKTRIQNFQALDPWSVYSGLSHCAKQTRRLMNEIVLKIETKEL